MAVKDQVITKEYAIYCGDSCEVLQTLPDFSIDLSIYSPPFAGEKHGLYCYSSDPRDFSNNTYEQFFEQYDFLVSEIARLTKPGRSTAVHCIDVPKEGSNIGGLIDFPGDIIRLHQKHGFEYWSRRTIWKEPLAVRNRTMAKGLAHAQICKDSSMTTCAGSDYLLQFRKKGENNVPVSHPTGLDMYAGGQSIPSDVLKYRGHTGKQTQNRYSHWIWRQYASGEWFDIRIDNVLPYKESKEEDDERHVHPLQLDVIERAVILWSNPGEVVLTPFMGVGSEVFKSVELGRKGVGIELKPSYFRQAERNLEHAQNIIDTQVNMF